jgi:tetratricopeptide (TPR) repeat protein
MEYAVKPDLESLRIPKMNRLRKWPLASVFLISAAALCHGQAPSVESITAALRANDLDRAAEMCSDGLKQSPNNPKIWTLQGIILARKGANNQALASFLSALKLAPDDVAALAGASQIYYQEGKQNAVPLLKRLVQLRPTDPTAHAMLAVLEYQHGDCETASLHFSKAGILIDSQIDALHAYATCQVRLSRLDDAVETFKKSVELKPDDPRERQILASIQMMAHKPADALVTLKPLLDAPNADADTLRLASRAFEDIGDTPQAVSTLREAILLAPRNTSLYLDFANICFAHQSFQVGVDVISEGISLQKDADELYVARGVLYVQLAQYSEAEADFERAYQLNPNQSLSTAAQGLAAVQANDLNHALQSIQTKLARKPNDPLLLYLQADVLSQRGAEPGTPDFVLALRSAKKAVALQPTLAAAHTVLAKLYMETGQYHESIAQCRKALLSDPKDQTAVYRLIQGLRKTGQQKEIPGLLTRLAELREQASKDERERNRYKLFEEGKPQSAGPLAPRP